MEFFAVVEIFQLFRGIGCCSGQFLSVQWHRLWYWEVLRLSVALFVVLGIVGAFSGSVCSSGQSTYYQSHWL